MTRKEFDRLTKRNIGHPLTHYDHHRWVMYREDRLRPHPGYGGSDHYGVARAVVAPRLPSIDKWADHPGRRYIRAVNIMGRQMAKSLNARVIEQARLIATGPKELQAPPPGVAMWMVTWADGCEVAEGHTAFEAHSKVGRAPSFGACQVAVYQAPL
jgi:hypothetical protein